MKITYAVGIGRGESFEIGRTDTNHMSYQHFSSKFNKLNICKEVVRYNFVARNVRLFDVYVVTSSDSSLPSLYHQRRFIKLVPISRFIRCISQCIVESVTLLASSERTNELFILDETLQLSISCYQCVSSVRPQSYF